MATHLWLFPDRKDEVDKWSNWANELTSAAVPLNHARGTNPIAHQVFDHVTPKEALMYAQLAVHLPPAVRATATDALLAWDRATMQGLRGVLTPTATKYLGTLGKLCAAYGEAKLAAITHWYEVGGGYGGMAVMLAAVFPAARVTCYDLPAIAGLQNMIFAECGCADRATSHPYAGDLPKVTSPQATSFLLSEHAWSECPDHVREVYLAQVFAGCAQGWLTNNDFYLGSEGTIRSLETVGITARPVDTFIGSRSYTVCWGCGK